MFEYSDEYDAKTIALAKLLELKPAQLENIESNGNEFEYDGTEYCILTDEESREMIDSHLDEMIEMKIEEMRRLMREGAKYNSFGREPVELIEEVGSYFDHAAWKRDWNINYDISYAIGDGDGYETQDGFDIIKRDT